MSRALSPTSWLRRFGIGLVALVAAGAAAWVNPPPEPGSSSTAPQSRAATPPAQPASPPTRLASLPPASDAAAASPLEIVRWGFGDRLGRGQAASATTVRPGRPLYLWMTVDGGQAAVDRLRADGRLAIEVHWTRPDTETSRGAPDLVTRLTIGRRGLASYFAAQVQKEGHFEWHSWARKDALSRGTWNVSLTYPDGQPVLCGMPAVEPCHFSITVG